LIFEKGFEKGVQLMCPFFCFYCFIISLKNKLTITENEKKGPLADGGNIYF